MKIGILNQDFFDVPKGTRLVITRQVLNIGITPCYDVYREDGEDLPTAPDIRGKHGRIDVDFIDVVLTFEPEEDVRTAAYLVFFWGDHYPRGGMRDFDSACYYYGDDISERDRCLEMIRGLAKKHSVYPDTALFQNFQIVRVESGKDYVGEEPSYKIIADMSFSEYFESGVINDSELA